MPIISINITNDQAQRLVAGLSGKFVNTETFPSFPNLDTALQKYNFIVDATKELWKDAVRNYEFSAGVDFYARDLRNTLQTGVSF